MDLQRLKSAMADAVAEDASRADWTDAEWSAWFNGPVTVVRERFVNERTLYGELGLAVGEEILQRLDAAAAADAVIARVRGWFAPSAGGVDVGMASTRAMLDQLQAGGVLTADQVTAIKAMAEGMQTRSETLGLGELAQDSIKYVLVWLYGEQS